MHIEILWQGVLSIITHDVNFYLAEFNSLHLIMLLTFLLSKLIWKKSEKKSPEHFIKEGGSFNKSCSVMQDHGRFEQLPRQST